MVLKIHDSKPHGFTIIELLVVIVVTIVLVGGAIVSYNTYTERQRVHQAIITFKSDLRFAQTKAMSGQKPTSDSCVTFEGYEVSISIENLYSIHPVCRDSDDLEVTDYPVASTTVSLPDGVVVNSSIPMSIRFHAVSKGVTVTPNVPITFIGINLSEFGVIIDSTGVISDY